MIMYIGVEAGSELVPEERWLSCDAMRLVGCIIMPGICGRFIAEGGGCICDMSCSGIGAHCCESAGAARAQNNDAKATKRKGVNDDIDFFS